MNKHKIGLCVSMVIAVFLFAIRPAISETKQISLTFMQWPPFEFVENGIPQGIDLEIAKTTLEKLGFKVNLINYPWKRALNAAKHGEADGIFSMGKRPEREIDFFYPSEPLIISGWYLYFPKKKVVPFEKDFKALKNLRIGICDGYVFPKEFMESTLFERDKSTDDLQNLKKLRGGRVDAIVGDNINCQLLIKKHGMTGLFKMYEKTPVDIIPMYVGFSKKSKALAKYPNLVKDFSETLKGLKKSGEVDKIAEKYGITYPK